MEKEVEEVVTKAKKDEEAEVEVDLKEDRVTLEILLNTKDCVLP